MLDAAWPEAMADAADVTRASLTLWPEASLAEVETSAIAALTWRLAGLVTAADWIGSNPGWFLPRPSGRGQGLGRFLQSAGQEPEFVIGPRHGVGDRPGAPVRKVP